MGKIKEYLMAEKKLEDEYEKQFKENVIYLNEENFINGRFSHEGYNHLKQNSDYIPSFEDVTIVVPEQYMNNFKSVLNNMSAVELSHIKKDLHSNLLKAGIFLVVGILIMIISALYVADDYPIVQDILVIASWVFVWAAVEDLFFSRKQLVNRKYKILQIVTSKVVSDDKSLNAQ